MDINKEENLIETKQELKEMHEDDNDNDKDEEEQQNLKSEEPKVIQMNSDQIKEGDESDNNNKKEYVDDLTSNPDAPIGKKEMESILLNLNSYWLELLGSITLIFSLIIYGWIAFSCLTLINELLQLKFNMQTITDTYNTIVNDIGLKWFLFITMSQHLAVGFFCLTTFSNMFKETSNIKKFFIVNIIKVALFYVLSVIILKAFIQNGLGNFFHNKIDETQVNNKEKVYQVFDDLVEKILRIVGDFLGTFNTFLEKITIGMMYICLFKDSEGLVGKKLLYFRLLAIIPVIYIIVSLVLRALHNTKKLDISVYVIPLLLGPKITIYLFFVITLSLIKYKSIAYNVFDTEKSIHPKVFSKIGSKIFGILGIIELIIGLFFPSWSPVGIGGKYLLVLCAPIMTLYDYKKNYVLKFPCCKKGNMTLCFKIVILIIGWLLVILFILGNLVLLNNIFESFIGQLIEFMINNVDVIIEIISLVLG